MSGARAMKRERSISSGTQPLLILSQEGLENLANEIALRIRCMLDGADPESDRDEEEEEDANAGKRGRKGARKAKRRKTG